MKAATSGSQYLVVLAYLASVLGWRAAELQGWRGGRGHVAGRPAGASTSLPFLLQGMLRTRAHHRPTNQFFQCVFDQMTDKAPP